MKLDKKKLAIIIVSAILGIAIIATIVVVAVKSKSEQAISSEINTTQEETTIEPESTTIENTALAESTIKATESTTKAKKVVSTTKLETTTIKSVEINDTNIAKMKKEYYKYLVSKGEIDLSKDYDERKIYSFREVAYKDYIIAIMFHNYNGDANAALLVDTVIGNYSFSHNINYEVIAWKDSVACPLADLYNNGTFNDEDIKAIHNLYEKA